MLKRLWNDESGAVLSAELVLLMTIVGIAMVVGLAAVRDAVVNELNDVGEALAQISQTYTFDDITDQGGLNGGDGSVQGAGYDDVQDTFDGQTASFTLGSGEY